MARTRLPADVIRKNGLEERTLAAYRAAVRKYARRRDITGVTIAIKETGGELHPEAGPVIAIHVAQKLTKVAKALRIPRAILGTPTDIIQADFKLTQGVTLPNPSIGAIPLRPGASIGRAKKGTAATMGAVVLKAGVPHLLTAAHVLREGGAPKKGDAIVHPGPRDAAGQPSVVARFGETHLGIDAGIARLELTVGATNTALFSQVRIGVPQNAVIGDTVEKCGRTTKRTQAIVHGIGTVRGLFPAMSLRPLPGDVLPISEDGDSGSVWYDAITFAAKGLHVGVDPDSGRAVATLMPAVMSGLTLTWI